jgi:hypothetical protein
MTSTDIVKQRCEFESRSWRDVLDTLCDSLSVTCDRSMFIPGTPISSTNKTDSHDITEILLKVALNIINQTKPNKNVNEKQILVDSNQDNDA